MRTSWIVAMGLVSACATDATSELELELASTSDDDVTGPTEIGNYSTLTGSTFPTDGAFFTPQGRNGRSCVTCHVPGDGWAFNAATAQRVFAETGGLDPLFSRLDADVPTLTDAQIDAMSVEERRGVFTMLLQGKFTRNVTLPATRNFDLTAVRDPFGISAPTDGTQRGRMWFFRTSMPTANFIGPTVSWDGANTVGTDLYAGLVRQIRGNITGAQEGDPAADAVAFEIADFELAMHHATAKVAGVGKLDKHGGAGGAEQHAADTNVAGPFDLFDGYATSDNAHRRAIYRGQELFNRGDVNGRRCAGCHNAANSGQHVSGALFDVGVGRPELASPDMAVFTFTEHGTGRVHVTTDPGRGGRSGNFADLGKFKTPTLRGLAARTSFFHNGVATSLPAVVRVYERTLGFDFTDAEEADLVAFLTAL